MEKVWPEFLSLSIVGGIADCAASKKTEGDGGPSEVRVSGRSEDAGCEEQGVSGDCGAEDKSCLGEGDGGKDEIDAGAELLGEIGDELIEIAHLLSLLLRGRFVGDHVGAHVVLERFGDGD